MNRAFSLVLLLSAAVSSIAAAATLLSREQYLATFADGNKPIEAATYQAADVWAYVRTVPAGDYAGYEICWGYVPFVYRTSDDAYDHVYVSTRTANAFLIILKDNRTHRIYGHHLLDLNVEYNIKDPKRLSRRCGEK